MHRSEVERVAREYVDTPFRHQQRLKRVGADCCGVVLGIGIECSILHYTAARWAPFRGYSRRPNPAQLYAFCETFLVPLEISRREIAPACSVALIAWRPGLAMHMAFLAHLPDGRPSIIHATEAAGRTVEHGFVAEWPELVDSWWAYPGIQD